MESPFVDIHRHYSEADESSNSEDFRSSNSDVSDVVSIYSHLIGSQESLPCSDYATGIHPWDANQTGLNYPIPSDHLIAIGEIGLDFSMAVSAKDRATQKRVFVDQIRLAEQMQLPIIIHCVKAYNELIHTLKQHTVITIIHGFRGSSELASQLLNVGCYLSFGEAILTSKKAASAIKQIPAERLFLETDQSKLSIEDIYNKAASIRGCTTLSIREQIYNNYLRLFRYDMA